MAGGKSTMARQHSLMKIVDLGEKRTEIGGGTTTNVSVLMASISFLKYSLILEGMYCRRLKKERCMLLN